MPAPKMIRFHKSAQDGWLPHHREAAGLGIRKRAQQYRIKHAEDGGIGANADGERENGDRSEQGLFGQQRGDVTSTGSSASELPLRASHRHPVVVGNDPGAAHAVEAIDRLPAEQFTADTFAGSRFAHAGNTDLRGALNCFQTTSDTLSKHC
jgi:hypothetical protein